MQKYQELCQNLQKQTVLHGDSDGFYSGELRNMILDSICKKSLPQHTREESSSLLELDETSQIKSKYYRTCRTIGGTVSANYLAGKLLPDTPEYLKKLITDGAETIGREIAGSYAASLYPELRRMQITGVIPPVEHTQSDQKIEQENYGFTIYSYSNCMDIGSMETTFDHPGSEIFYDDINERFIERFVFQDINDADAVRGSWLRYAADNTLKPPVKYALCIERETPQSVPEISSIEHIDSFSKDTSRTLENGIEQKIFVYDTIGQADAARKDFLQIIRNTVPQDDTPALEVASPSKSNSRTKQRRREQNFREKFDEHIPEIPKSRKKDLPISK